MRFIVYSYETLAPIDGPNFGLYDSKWGIWNYFKNKEEVFGFLKIYEKIWR